MIINFLYVDKLGGKLQILVNTCYLQKEVSYKKLTIEIQTYSYVPATQLSHDFLEILNRY